MPPGRAEYSTMSTATLGMHTEQYPSHTLACQTTSHCTSYQPTPLTLGKISPLLETSTPGQTTPSPSSKTASQRRSGVYLRVWTWRSTESVLSYFTFCAENITITKQTRVSPNQKPLVTSEVDRNTAFRSGDRAQYSTARANLKRGITVPLS